jgi:hypothetical protein
MEAKLRYLGGALFLEVKGRKDRPDRPSPLHYILYLYLHDQKHTDANAVKAGAA